MPTGGAAGGVSARTSRVSTRVCGDEIVEVPKYTPAARARFIIGA